METHSRKRTQLHYAVTVLIAVTMSLIVGFGTEHIGATPQLGTAIGSGLTIGMISSFLVRPARSPILVRSMILIGAVVGSLMGLALYLGLTS